MSELIQNPSPRLAQLIEFGRQFILPGSDSKLLVERYRPYIDTVTAMEAMLVLDQLLVDGNPLSVVKHYTGKLINLFFKSLDSAQWPHPQEGHFVWYLMQENRRVEALMDDIKQLNKQMFASEGVVLKVFAQELKGLMQQVREYELHYIKKENILFPIIEQTFAQHRCLHIMWSFHDDFRKGLKAIEVLLDAEVIDKKRLAKEVGDLFFVVLPLIFREEQIVFPVAIRAIPAQQWDDMLTQSMEVGWCYGIQPVVKASAIADGKVSEGLINLGTGQLNAQQMMLMLNHLPVDITFVDENDEVRYFSGGMHRIFPRSKAIIGRKVQNCHPQESVHVVNAIVEAFRSGAKEHADFWIEMKGRFIHIRYFALRDESGNYKGTIEVSQDATEIRQLKGEQRLLDWE